MSKYEVGQTVVVTDVNYRGPAKHATITKVGTKLVYIDKDVYGRENSPYRIADGNRNDNYRHSSIYTLEEYAEKTERAELISALREEGVIFERGTQAFPTSRLRAIMEVFK